jgi:hypothetical protein
MSQFVLCYGQFYDKQIRGVNESIMRHMRSCHQNSKLLLVISYNTIKQMPLSLPHSPRHRSCHSNPTPSQCTLKNCTVLQYQILCTRRTACTLFNSSTVLRHHSPQHNTTGRYMWYFWTVEWYMYSSKRNSWYKFRMNCQNRRIVTGCHGNYLIPFIIISFIPRLATMCNILYLQHTLVAAVITLIISTFFVEFQVPHLLCWICIVIIIDASALHNSLYEVLYIFTDCELSASISEHSIPPILFS